jgi:class 3 adenylate cyclase
VLVSFIAQPQTRRTAKLSETTHTVARTASNQEPNMTSVDLSSLLGVLDDNVRAELASTPDVVDKGDDLDLSCLPISARKWHKVSDAVAVVADLKNSTKLGTGKWAASTAGIYEASTGGVVKVFDDFDADFIAIQGDGAFALFWGNRRYERAICAGITVKTFSRDMVIRLEKRWPDLPETGFKVGIASSRLLVKRIGTPRNLAQQEPVWAGKAVNYAAKAAQGADRHIMVVTARVWERVERNDYLAATCPCGIGPSLNLWTDTVIERLPDGDPEAQGHSLTVSWCKIHGKEYCDAVLDGRQKRDDIGIVQKALDRNRMQTALRNKAQTEQRSAWSRRRAGR